MPDPLNTSPAHVLRQALVDLALGSMPTDEQDWPIYATNEPPIPDDSITVLGTAGVKVGRLFLTGETVTYPGLQIRVRASDPNVGRAKALEISRALDAIYEMTVVDQLGTGSPNDEYVIHDVQQTGDILTLGRETTTSKRSGFTINALITIRMIGV